MSTPAASVVIVPGTESVIAHPLPRSLSGASVATGAWSALTHQHNPLAVSSYRIPDGRAASTGSGSLQEVRAEALFGVGFPAPVFGKPPGMATGAQLLEISNGISALKRECFGKGPARAKAIQDGNLVLVIMTGGFIEAEHTLINHQRADAVRAFRTVFEVATRPDMTAVVERALGIKVVDYMSQVLAATDTQVDIFVLDDHA